MYRNLTKFLKITNKSLFSKIIQHNIPKPNTAILINSNKFNFCENFEKQNKKEKISGNLNLKQVFAGKESPLIIIDFIEQNIDNMNDIDYLDALLLIFQKISNDNSELVTKVFRNSKIYDIFRNWIKQNFNKYVVTNSTSFLIFAFESNKRNLNIFDHNKKSTIVNSALNFVERSIKTGKAYTVNIILN